MSLLLHGIIMFCLFLMGVLYLFPMQSHTGVFFGVSVPVEFSHSAEGRSIRRKYQLRGIPLQLLALLAGIGVLLHNQGQDLSLVLLGQLVCGMGNWMFAARQVRVYAIRPPLVRTASLAKRSHLDVTWIGYAAAALPLLLAAFYLHTHWAQIPDVFPIHWGIHGRPNRWTYKSMGSVYGMVGLGSGLLIFMMLIDKMLPRASEENRKRSSVVLSGIAGFVALMQAYIALMPFHNAVAVWEILGSSMVAIILVLAVELVSIGSQPKAAQEPYDGTPDACWYGSMFYCNREDPALMVPKRFGIGYTFNFGRPAAWWMLVAAIFVPILFSLLLSSHK